jgi:uncharacterized protein YbjT (DUF2867 family)
MTKQKKTILVLGGSGRTGSLLAKQLSVGGSKVRSASRHGSQFHFDWDDVDTYEGALSGIDRVYLVAPTMRVRYVEPVAKFLDLAEAAGVSHVTLLSAFNGDQAPEEIDVAAVEVEVARRRGLTHTILRPAWVMQNFADQHLPIVENLLVVPSGGGAEAFVDALDIAEVAAATLLKPDEHAGATYLLTGPQAITFDEAARTIASVSGRPIKYLDCDQETWINGAVAAGVPPDYAEMLRWLTGSIISGSGSTPTGDVAAVIGRPATSFEEFALRNAAVWTNEEDR